MPAANWLRPLLSPFNDEASHLCPMLSHHRRIVDTVTLDLNEVNDYVPRYLGLAIHPCGCSSQPPHPPGPRTGPPLFVVGRRREPRHRENMLLAESVQGEVPGQPKTPNESDGVGEDFRFLVHLDLLAHLDLFLAGWKVR